MHIGFRFLTACASFDIFLYKLSESRPVIVISNEFPSVCDSWVSCCWCVIKGAENFTLYFGVIFEEGFVCCQGGRRKKMIREKSAW